MFTVHDEIVDLYNLQNKLEVLNLPKDDVYSADLHTERFLPTDTGSKAIHVVYHFDNGYGISLIRHKFSHGQDSDLFEIAVVSKREGWHIDYETPFSMDVEGWLDTEEVNTIFREVRDFNGKIN